MDCKKKLVFEETYVKNQNSKLEEPYIKNAEVLKNESSSNLENPSTPIFDSILSLEKLNLELPNIENYQGECAEFPSSPYQLKVTKGQLMPKEDNSNNIEECSDEEEDKSMYQAVLSPDCQDVRLKKERPGSLVASQKGGRKKISVSADILKILDSDDPDDSVASDGNTLSPDVDIDFEDVLTPDSNDELEESIMSRLGDPLPLPELTAAQERAEARSWRQCIVAGIERRIDMRVIEPYKRVLSHGGYLDQGSRNAILVFSACFLPHRTRVDYDYVMDNLFLYVITTLDQLVTDDYVLVYLHGATLRQCMPSFGWLKRCYQMIDRRLRKNLKGLYLVHPTFWLKTIVLMTRPFISSKFRRKLRFVETLTELNSIIPLERASIPDRVKELEESIQNKKHKTMTSNSVI